MKKSRVIGTTEESIMEEENKIGFEFPASFKKWLIKNNGLSIENIRIYPVKDKRDIRKTWESISHNYQNSWSTWLDNFDDKLSFDHLLPFADFDTGDYYCFDYSNSYDEKMVVLWSHETGKTEFRANNFEEFIALVKAGKFDYD